MSVELVRVYVAVCDGCSRQLGNYSSYHETYDTEAEAQRAAQVAGWHLHPDGTMYCDRGHQ